MLAAEGRILMDVICRSGGTVRERERDVLTESCCRRRVASIDGRRPASECVTASSSRLLPFIEKSYNKNRI